ncbi:hypothetical protein Q75_00285 [Bacillus coahuilensis p1.1.43]|uniref:CRISPR-associated protein Cas2 n=1 Tax=Bacillus coahuilensis p1.1.43 TaxID=1150625 RepID=A0A147KCI1_9BACI|nr:hypothetical protein [Bacillus coahuilensis]KUP09403.1 hypothetical protein Q75_00285 [Bacillus coahuilensis p1.1.43]
MASEVYVFSYVCAFKEDWTNRCIDERMSKLYDIRKIYHALYMIKTTKDVELLEKYLVECFDNKDAYFLVDITDKPNRYKNIDSTDITIWLDDI